MFMGFLGGTGNEARGLALRFAAAGNPVFLGSRSPERAHRAAEACNLILGAASVRGGGNAEMLANSDIVFLTVPFLEAVNAIENYRGQWNSYHILVDVTVPMTFREGHAEYLEQEGKSNAEIISQNLPGDVSVVAAFKTIPASLLADLEAPLDCDVFVCGNSENAKQRVMAAAAGVLSLRPLNSGPLRAARTLERMAVLAVELNRKYRKKSARYRVAGLD